MKINNLLIHLHNNVDSFSLKPRHVDLLREIFPDTCITVAKETSDFLEKLPEADCALAWVFKSAWYESALKLKVLFTPAAGHDWVDTDPSGRVKTFYGRFHGRIMRESLLSMMLHFNRHIGTSLDYCCYALFQLPPRINCPGKPLLPVHSSVIPTERLQRQYAPVP